MKNFDSVSSRIARDKSTIAAYSSEEGIVDIKRVANDFDAMLTEKLK